MLGAAHRFAAGSRLEIPSSTAFIYALLLPRSSRYFQPVLLCSEEGCASATHAAAGVAAAAAAAVATLALHACIALFISPR